MKTLLVLVVVLWAGAVGAQNPCDGITTDIGRSPVEIAKMYREHHECMMRTADQATEIIDNAAKAASQTYTTYFSSPTGCYAEFGSPPKTLEVECSQPKGLPVPVCMQKMEQAMRAMEKQFYYKHDGRMIFPFKPEGEPIPASVESLISQWAEAKACWRQP